LKIAYVMVILGSGVVAGACGGGAGGKTAGTGGGGGRIGTTGTAGTTGSAGTNGAAGTTGTAGTIGDAGIHPAEDGVDAPPLPFEAQVQAIAAEYLAWGRVDDELRWAPWLCRAPYPGITRPSESTDESTHGRKLYSVFAKNHAAYPNGPHDDQVVVKQSWVPELVDTDAGLQLNSYRSDAGVDADHFYPYAKGDGGVYRASALAGLFIMFKLDPAVPETDEGWVYATVSAGGQVTSSGRVASCMGCHETSATHERLYGVPLSPSFP
jgi:hypothetical protein